MTAMQELVVPKSIPITLAIAIACWQRGLKQRTFLDGISTTQDIDPQCALDIGWIPRAAKLSSILGP
jgi:hypothetical protein